MVTGLKDKLLQRRHLDKENIISEITYKCSDHTILQWTVLFTEPESKTHAIHSDPLFVFMRTHVNISPPFLAGIFQVPPFIYQEAHLLCAQLSGCSPGPEEEDEQECLLVKRHTDLTRTFCP